MRLLFTRSLSNLSLFLPPVHETNHDNELNESNKLSNVNLELAEELIRIAEKCENTFEKTFKKRVLLKIKSDLRN